MKKFFRLTRVKFTLTAFLTTFIFVAGPMAQVFFGLALVGCNELSSTGPTLTPIPIHATDTLNNLSTIIVTNNQTCGSNEPAYDVALNIYYSGILVLVTLFSYIVCCTFVFLGNKVKNRSKNALDKTKK